MPRNANTDDMYRSRACDDMENLDVDLCPDFTHILTVLYGKTVVPTTQH